MDICLYIPFIDGIILFKAKANNPNVGTILLKSADVDKSTNVKNKSPPKPIISAMPYGRAVNSLLFIKASLCFIAIGSNRVL